MNKAGGFIPLNVIHVKTMMFKHAEIILAFNNNNNKNNHQRFVQARASITV